MQIPSIPRPYLAFSGDFSIEDLPFPLLASTKIDGVRALIHQGKVFSRTGKLIPNRHVQEVFGLPELEGFDGELCVGPANAPNLMQATVSGVMSKERIPDVTFFAFDLFNSPLPFEKRTLLLMERTLALDPKIPAHTLTQIKCYFPEELLSLEDAILSHNYEGVILRSPHGYYKNGRSTLKEFFSPKGGMLKLKRFSQEEATVLSILPAQENFNEAFANEIGYTKRSTSKENLLTKEELGTFVCTSPNWPVRFGVAPGHLTREERIHIWKNQASFIGKTLSFKHFPKGSVRAPRLPQFVSWRPPE